MCADQRVCSLLLPRGSQGLSSHHQGWWQALLPTKPSCQPLNWLFKWQREKRLDREKGQRSINTCPPRNMMIRVLIQMDLHRNDCQQRKGTETRKVKSLALGDTGNKEGDPHLPGNKPCIYLYYTLQPTTDWGKIHQTSASLCVVLKSATSMSHLEIYYK